MSRVSVLLLAVLVQPACSAPSSPARPAAAPATSTATPATTTQVTGKAAAGALVTLEAGAGPAAVPQGAVIMDQFSKAFVPETLFVRVGQPVTFKNSEDQLHNITVVRSRTGARVLNISQNQGDVHTHTFEQSGEYDVSCDVHPGMRATIVAATTPYAVYADERGTFAFQNVTPGEYRLRVSAEGRDNERTVTVSGATLDISQR